MSDVDDFLPLSAAALQILLALASQDMHGYAIMQEVERQSDGRYRLGPGTLYDSLQRMTKQGLTKELPLRSTDGRGRRVYRLTGLGRKTLSAEIDRLEGILREGRIRLGGADLRQRLRHRERHGDRRRERDLRPDPR